MNLNYLKRGEYMMKKKFLLAITPILLGIICLGIHASNSSVAPDGLLIEPYFFLVPVSYVLFLTGTISVLFVAIVSVFKKGKCN
ncbi:DUF3955 domain-containing protein [Bacillus pfraonensis]|nr:DUF3955 domain-containing protein [Bacillus pseudomycoides]